MLEPERLLPYCKSKPQEDAVRAVIKHGTQQKAADALGKNLSNIAEAIQRVKRYAKEQGDHLLPLTGQSHLIRDEEGRMVRWDKTKTVMTAADMFEEMKAGIDCKLARPKKMPKGVKDNLCSVLTIADPHIGMLAYEGETGQENYSTSIAVERLTTAIDILFPRGHKVKHGVMLNLGDLIHFDGMKAVTPQSGNVLDADSRYGHVTRSAVAIIRYAVDRMLEHCETLEIMNIRGNHDESSLLMLNTLCQHVYANEPRILPIKNNDCKVMTHSWERNFIYGYHGDGIKPQVAFNGMVRDCAKEMAAANYVWMPSGHLHNERVQWIGNAKLEVMTTLAPNDAWHASKLYGSHREMVRTDLHPMGGRVGGAIFNPVLHNQMLEAA